MSTTAAPGDRYGRALPGPDLHAAQRLTRQRASSFHLASQLIPSDVRSDVYILYALFRALDDLVDVGLPDAAERVGAVEAFASGEAAPRTPEVVALSDLSHRHRLPGQPLLDFCAGMRQDLDPRPFMTERDVDRYCYRVAGTVGLTMLPLLGVRPDDDAGAAAVALGMAMQRTNILRDLDEDRARGRVYIAQQSLRRHGASLEPSARGALVRDQIARADLLYEDGLAGIGCLRRGAGAIRLAAGLYREILREIERRDGGRRPGRAVVAPYRKLAVAARTLVGA